VTNAYMIIVISQQ